KDTTGRLIRVLYAVDRGRLQRQGPRRERSLSSTGAPLPPPRPPFGFPKYLARLPAQCRLRQSSLQAVLTERCGTGCGSFAVTAALVAVSSTLPHGQELTLPKYQPPKLLSPRRVRPWNVWTSTTAQSNVVSMTDLCSTHCNCLSGPTQRYATQYSCQVR